MSLPIFVENLRTKSPAHRKRIQIIVPIVVTFLILTFWVFSFGSHVQTIVNEEKTNGKPSPFRVIANSFTSVFSNITEGVNITADRLKGEEEKNINDGAGIIYVKE